MYLPVSNFCEFVDYSFDFKISYNAKHIWARIPVYTVSICSRETIYYDYYFQTFLNLLFTYSSSLSCKRNICLV